MGKHLSSTGGVFVSQRHKKAKLSKLFNDFCMKKWFRYKLHARNKGNWVSSFLRLCYFRLIVPILRSPDQPHSVARGVAVGLVVGSTPTVGIQMPLIFGIWCFGVYVLQWRFSLVLAVAWSFISNVFTALPLYYLFYVTGSVMVGELGSAQSFSIFSSVLGVLNNPNQGFVESLVSSMLLLGQKVGFEIFIGCIPFAIVLGTTGYLLSYNLSQRFFNRRRAVTKRKKNSNRLALRRKSREKNESESSATGSPDTFDKG